MLYSSALRAHSSTRRTTTTLSRTSKSMSSPLSSALENHLQQFGSSSDVDCDSASDASERERGLGRNQSQRQRRSVGNLTSEELSFWGLVFAETSPGRGASTVKVCCRRSGGRNCLSVSALGVIVLLVCDYTPSTSLGPARSCTVILYYCRRKCKDRLMFI